MAPGLPGRWNKTGQQVIYTAESIPLAFMENMIRRKGIGLNDQFAIMFINVPRALALTEIRVEDLEKGWRDHHNYSICQNAADKWYNNLLSPVLKVPSAVLSTNYNYVINAQHPDYRKIKIESVTGLMPDERIEEILKKYESR